MIAGIHLFALSILAFAVEALNLNTTSSYSGSAAASWALSCIPGCSECPECTSSTCSCGCTYFTTHAMVHGGAPNGYEGTCAVLWSNFKAGKYSGWVSKGTSASSILPGDAVIMNNGKSGDASHCCVGTSAGLISCHNPSHANVPPSSTWYSGGYINAIWGVSSSSSGKCPHLGYYCGNDGLGLDANNLYFCSGSGANPALKTACSFTCVTMPSGEDDVCSTSGTCAHVNTGYYCGSDKISGDADTLYLCQSSSPSGAKKCDKGCYIAASGSNDYCK